MNAFLNSSVSLLSPVPPQNGAIQTDRAEVDDRQRDTTEEVDSEVHCRQAVDDGRRPDARVLGSGSAASPVRRGCVARDTQVPEEHQVIDPPAAVPTTGARDRHVFGGRRTVPVCVHDGPARSQRGLSRRTVRGHQPVRRARQTRDHHAQRPLLGLPYPRQKHMIPNCILFFFFSHVISIFN